MPTLTLLAGISFKKQSTVEYKDCLPSINSCAIILEDLVFLADKSPCLRIIFEARSRRSCRRYVIRRPAFPIKLVEDYSLCAREIGSGIAVGHSYELVSFQLSELSELFNRSFDIAVVPIIFPEPANTYVV